jgi:hypothetical protein
MLKRFGYPGYLKHEWDKLDELWKAVADYEHLTDHIDRLFNIQFTNLMLVDEAYEEGDVTQSAENAFNNLLTSYREQIEIAIRQIEGSKNAKRSPTGHAAYTKSWLDYWDDAWAERRENDKGWKVGNKEVLAALPDNIPQPNRSTITRQRKIRRKELDS